ncbi:GNAT family N-acetyltransferase [Celeribacter indicus]|uniref:Acetyltransferase n=1 Tax=Celeribacter indicus TaxID=1208324 RepID=A0A0B5E2P5_9RHOB|nr:GNAT family N-acetyltransferase [Celeribacter indicus]AJE47645.1 acetyltransferase [Celeribacter indicus]SDW13009.1 Acetyltransferase (GNAT) family protein [Celeribacter indicus]
MSAPTAVRPLAPSDRPGWEGLWRAYLAFSGTALPEDIHETTFRRLTDPHNAERGALVAEREGRLVGLAHYIFHAHNWRGEDVCYLQDLYVGEAARGSGTGRALIEGVYAAADANGTPQVYWMTEAGNDGARQLYDRIGALTPFIKYQRR